jgi:CubicO group peptidase (beta-lactamase class C family)
MRIDDMKPGPELNAEFAKALGKPNLRKYNHCYVWDNVGYVNGKPVGSVMGTIDVPEYSTTWDGMSEVVGEMQRRGYRYLLHDTHNGISLAQFQKYNAEYELTGFGRSEGKTAPHAVTLAAIRALQGEQ